MNIVKVLKKQIDNGKNIMLADGNIISKDETRKAMMKSYLAGIKTGEVPTTQSFENYVDAGAEDFIEVQEVIDFIQGTPEEDEENEEDEEDEENEE